MLLIYHFRIVIFKISGNSYVARQFSWWLAIDKASFRFTRLLVCGFGQLFPYYEVSESCKIHSFELDFEFSALKFSGICIKIENSCGSVLLISAKVIAKSNKVMQYPPNLDEISKEEWINARYDTGRLLTMINHE